MNLFRLRDGNYRNQKFNRSALLLVALVLACFAISPMAQAVLPAPDGGYPGGNTAEGQNALLSLTTGGFNTAVGFFSLRSDTTGQFNTAIGAGALLLNTADNNTATGAGALLSNTTGEQNTANGAFALLGNTEGNFNTANGVQALFSNTTGGLNTATGVNALYSNTTGTSNTANGVGALQNNTTGGFNTANGRDALYSNTTGTSNTASGFQALSSNTEGNNNTANGVDALKNNTGSSNTATGVSALQNNTTGDFNTAIGDGALFFNTTGNNNTALGVGAGNGITTANDVICIRNPGANVSNSCFIGNIRGVTTAITNAIPVLIDSAGQLGTMSSSRRFKKEIKPMDSDSEAILGLKPVTFQYKSDPSGTAQFGLIAEEVAEVDPDLVVRDADGKPYTVRYDAVNAMLLNEFLKEHRKVQEQEATIAQLKKEMETVVARLKQHDSKIQRVSAQIELGQTVGQTALNNP